MIILSNTIAQTLAPGQSLTFDNTIMRTGCNAECHRNGSSGVNLTKNGIYEINVKLNVAPTVDGTAQLAVMAGGSALPETTMVSTPSAANDVNTVCCSTGFRPCGCCGETLTIQNTGTVPVLVSADSCLFIKRIA